MLSCLRDRWKQAGGQQVYGEHWVRDKGKPLKATNWLLENVLQSAGNMQHLRWELRTSCIAAQAVR